MHWCYLPELDPSSEATSYQLCGEEAHHALKVMRLRVGDSCALFNGRGCVAQAIISAIEGSKSLWLGRMDYLPAQPDLPHLTLALSIPKGGNMELIVQKAVELGISRLVPLVSERCIVRLKEKEAASKQEKWQRTALEACKQCKAAYLPLVEPVQTLTSFLAQQPQGTPKLCCALVAEARPLRDILEPLRRRGARELTVLIGPEGDFSPREYESIMQAGYSPASLGSLILRVETAVFMALSAARYALDEAVAP